MPGHQPAQDDRSDNKRRKIDAVAAADLYPTASATCAQLHLNYSTLQRPVPSHTDGRHYVAWQPRRTPIATPCSAHLTRNIDSSSQLNGLRATALHPRAM